MGKPNGRPKAKIHCNVIFFTVILYFKLLDSIAYTMKSLQVGRSAIGDLSVPLIP